MQQQARKKVRFLFSSLGTDVEIQLWFDDNQKLHQCGKYFQEIEQIFEKAMKTFSRFDKQSELSKINASLGKKHPCSEWMRVVATSAIEYYNNTDCLFDPRIIDELEKSGYASDFKAIDFGEIFCDSELEVPVGNGKSLDKDLIVDNDGITFGRRMDFSGIVKGFVADEVSKYLCAAGFENFLVDSGGDIYACGRNGHEKFWYVDIEDIAQEKMLLKISNEGIATSGISRRKWEIKGKRMHHIVNPNSPQQYSFELKSVTVVASSAEMADVLAKVLFLKGEREGKIFAQKQGIKCIFLNYRNMAWVSAAVKENI